MRKKLGDLKLRTKLMLSFILLAGIPFLISSQILIRMAAENIKSNTTTYVSLFAAQVSSNIDSFISELDRMTKTTFLNTAVCDALRRESYEDAADAYRTNLYITQHIFNLTTQQPNIRCVILVNEQGKTFLSGISPVLSDYDSFAEIVRLDKIEQMDGRLVISPAHRPSYLFDSKGSAVFSLGRLIKDQNFQTAGKIVLDVNCSDLIELINVNPALAENGARIVVTNDEGEIVADTSEAFDPAGAAQTFSLGGFERDPRYVTFHTRSSYSGLSVSVVVPTRSLFYSVENFQSYVWMVTGILLGCIFLLALYLSYYMVRPIKRLEKMADEVRGGNFDISSDIHSGDEIGSLARSFDMMVDKIKNLVRNVYLSQIRNKQSQLDALQHQIDPHFLHNTLESIRMKAVLNHDPEVALMIKNLGKLFRITLDRRTNLVTIRDELGHVNAYLDIQNMRYDNRFCLDVQVDEALLACPIIKLVLQPIVENCVVHGFENTSGLGTITISAEERKGRILLAVQDDGDGIPPDQLAEMNRYLSDEKLNGMEESGHKSIGLKNISDRLKLEYGEEYRLSVESKQGGGTAVCFSVPRL